MEQAPAVVALPGDDEVPIVLELETLVETPNTANEEQKEANRTEASHSVSPGTDEKDLSDYDDTKKKNGELKSLSDGGDKGGDNSLEEEEEQQTQEQSHEAKELANAITRGDMIKIDKWIESMPHERRKDAFKFSTSENATALKFAVLENKPSIARAFLNAAGERELNSDIENAIKDGDIEAVMTWLDSLEGRNCDDYKHWDGGTALHLAAKFNKPDVAKELLNVGADPNSKRLSDQHTALHVASSVPSGGEFVCLLLEWNAVIDVSALQLAVKSGSLKVTEMLMEKQPSLVTSNETDFCPLHCACVYGHFHIAKLLLEHGVNLKLQKPGTVSPFRKAIERADDENIQLLIDHGIEIQCHDLKFALERENESAVKKFLKTSNWKVLMCQSLNGISTPLREMIRKMPDAAIEVLNKCCSIDSGCQDTEDKDFTVIFNYEFIDEWIDTHENRDDWRPKEYKKSNHPLALMVKYKRLSLLQHPLVRSLLRRKWLKFGLYFYLANLLTYCLFLIFLTTFALIVPHPSSLTCRSLASNESGLLGNNESVLDCGISAGRQGFIYFSAALVIFIASCRTFLELYQLISKRLAYLRDWVNWMEWCLFVCSIIFVAVFDNDCLCPLAWQWQIGVVVVFFGWIGLIVFLSKLPLIGIYIAMFLKIFKTLLKMIFFSFLLVVAFSLAFYMAFSEAEIMRSPFSSVPRSLLKVMTMTTGELEFDTIFRQDPSGRSDDVDEIPFPAISTILWVVFVILMPVLLTNMLIGLAVGDINAVRKEAELEKLALQVEYILTVEDLLPKKLRREVNKSHKSLRPNKKDGLKDDDMNVFVLCFCCLCCCLCPCLWFCYFDCEDLLGLFEEILGNLLGKNVGSLMKLVFWGEERYDTLKDVIKPQDSRSITDKLLQEVKEMKDTYAKERKMLLQQIKDTNAKEREALVGQLLVAIDKLAERQT